MSGICVEGRPDAGASSDGGTDGGTDGGPDAGASTDGGREDAGLTGDGGALLSLASSITFTDQAVGATSAPVQVTLTNLGSGASGTPTLGLSGDDGSMFAVHSTDCTGPITPGSACRIQLVFTPTAQGQRAATLTVDASPGGIATTILNGQAVAALTVSVSPQSGTFGAVALNTQGADQTFSVSASGPALAAPLAVILKGASSDFLITNDACAGQTAPCALSIAFTPTMTGVRKSTLTISAGGVVAAQVPLVGYGLNPAFLTLTPTTFSFGDALLGESRLQNFRVSNIGDVPSGTVGYMLTGASPEFQSRTSAAPCVGALQPFGDCLISVEFAPGSSGAFATQLQVWASAGGTQLASLIGQGISASQLVVSPKFCDFGSISGLNGAATQTFVVSNTSTSPLSLVHQISGMNGTSFTITSNGCAGGPLMPGSSCTLTVEFKPRMHVMRGVQTALLVTTASGPLPGQTVMTNLTGFGRAPAQLEALLPAFAFPSTMIGTTSAPEAFVFQNVGDATAGVASAPSITGPFKIVSSTCTGATLLGGASCVVFATFTPTSPAQVTGSLSLQSALGGTAVVPFGGTGLRPAALDLSDTTHQFGNVAVNSSQTKLFTVSNTGGATSAPLNINVTGFPAFTWSGGTCVAGATLAAGAACTIIVTFSPSVIGARTESLKVSASPGGMLLATLLGTGT